ncbi:MAG: tetratricopeptide repeat protein [Sulfuriferula sp.]
MSLINQMLQDLARRQAPSTNAPSQISPLNPPRKRKAVPVWMWIALMGLINIATVAWFSWHSSVHPMSGANPRTSLVEPSIPVAHPSVTPKLLAQIKLPATRVIVPQEAPSIVRNVPILTPIPTTTQVNRPMPNLIPPANENTATQSGTPVRTSPTDNSVASTNIPAAFSTNIPTAVAANIPVAPAATPPEGTITIKKQAKPLTQEQLAQNEYVKALNTAQQGDMVGAIAGFTQVLSLNPRHHQARLMLVGLLIESKRFAEAEHRLQVALAGDPAQIDFAMLLARLQIEHDSIDASIATLMRSLPYAANQADYHAFLAALLQRAGKNDQAIDHYAIALKQNPQSGLWWMGLGISEKAAKHAAEAHEAFTRARATNSLSPDLQAFVDQQLHQP